MVFLVGKSLGGADNNGVSRVYAYGVNVFHVAYGDGGVVRVAHYLVFDLLVALDALFHEHLMNGGELQARSAEYFSTFLVVVGKAAARSAESERGAKHYGIADLFRRLKSVFEGCP